VIQRRIDASLHRVSVLLRAPVMVQDPRSRDIHVLE
jgi:hypothetical protein